MSTNIIDDDGISNPSKNNSLTELIEQQVALNLSRRSFLKSGAAFGVAGIFGVGLSGCVGSDNGDNPIVEESPLASIKFQAVSTSTVDSVIVPDGYTAEVLYRWGDPCVAGAPVFLGSATESWQEQELQAGDNHDAIFFFPFKDATGSPRSDAGLLCINHEYINPEYFFPVGTINWYDNLDANMVKKMVAAHGVSVIEVSKSNSGEWSVVSNSTYNRRITGYTPIEISGPAKGHDLLKTATDPLGIEVLGTLNNCGAGMTPWGTYITCEENFNGYFGSENPLFVPTTHENRYGLRAGGFGYRWHTQDPRFDIFENRNEPNRFGWVVEIDPFSPASKPKKRTALGRFKHENAELVLSTSNQAVVYMGCDERNEYLYKFVSEGSYDANTPSSGNDLLDSGTLYVARLEAGVVEGDNKGVGTWIPLVFNENGLTVANGFTSQADILIRTRAAADRVGATMMDRPEWIAANPKQKGEVYLSCTNNNRRGSETPAIDNAIDGTTIAGSARPAIDDANPRAVNNWGHIIRWNETGEDAAATTFTWDIFVIVGNPNLADETKHGSENITVENTFNSPDGLQFDPEGRLWIQSDGNFSNLDDYEGQGNNQMLVADVKTGEIRRFMTGPSGCEVTGVTWTPDGTSCFVDIQHPGEVKSHPNQPTDLGIYPDMDAFVKNNPTAFSKWPDGNSAGRPRSATIVIRRVDGGVVGT